MYKRQHKAERALELLRNQPFDILVSDVGLPGMDGYALMRTIRSDPALASLPAAALTACAYVEDRERALAAGFQTHLRKPFEHAELFAVIADLKKLALSSTS